MSVRSVPCWVLAVVALAGNGAAHGGDGVVAIQTAAPACGNDSSDRYVDCENGTVTDNETGLVWLANANCPGAAVDGYEAMVFAQGLADLPDTSTLDGADCGLEDGSSPGEWRLPSIAEWEEMIGQAVDMGCIDGGAGTFGGPAITSDDGSTCWQEGPGNSFTGVESGPYWSATPAPSFADTAFICYLNSGALDAGNRDQSSVYVWPVRGGQ